jgi:hypothetical protein
LWLKRRCGNAVSANLHQNAQWLLPYQGVDPIRKGSDLVGAWWDIWHWAEEPKLVVDFNIWNALHSFLCLLFCPFMNEEM